MEKSLRLSPCIVRSRRGRSSSRSPKFKIAIHTLTKAGARRDPPHPPREREGHHLDRRHRAPDEPSCSRRDRPGDIPPSKRGCGNGRQYPRPGKRTATPSSHLLVLPATHSTSSSVAPDKGTAIGIANIAEFEKPDHARCGVQHVCRQHSVRPRFRSHLPEPGFDDASCTARAAREKSRGGTASIPGAVSGETLEAVEAYPFPSRYHSYTLSPRL